MTAIRSRTPCTCCKTGKIVAIKGLGGFHLACDARNAQAVARLRFTKNREDKPFAVMLANVASLAPYAQVSDAERALLESRERPIVLLRAQPGGETRFGWCGPGPAAPGCDAAHHTDPLTCCSMKPQADPAGTPWLNEATAHGAGDDQRQPGR